jgi:hypothetical protein
MVWSCPRVARSRPSLENCIAPVQVSGSCAFCTSIAGRENGPLPPYTTSDPSRATLASIVFPPSCGLAHARQHILLRPPFALLLCTIISLCCRLLLTSHIRIVLSALAVAQRFRSVGCHTPAEISATWPLVLCISRRYISPFTNSILSCPSRVYTFACGVAETTRILCPESSCENVAEWTWCEPVGSSERKACRWSIDMDGKS